MAESDQVESQSREEEEESSDESSPVLDTVKDVVAEAGQEAKDVVAEAGQEATPVVAQVLLDAVFSDTVRAQLLEQAEAGLQDLLDATIEALPGTESTPGLVNKLERTRLQIRVLLREMIEELFTGSTRAEFEQHMTDAARRLTDGDTDAAKDEAQLAGQTLLSNMLDVVQAHWGQILRVLLMVIAKALQEAVASHVKEAFAAIAAEPGKAVEEEVGPLQDQVKEKAEMLRERLEETRDTLQERLEEAKERLQERVAGGVSGAVHGGRSARGQFGRPPSGRPPSGPGGRRPPGRVPGGRPPSLSR